MTTTPESGQIPKRKWFWVLTWFFKTQGKVFTMTALAILLAAMKAPPEFVVFGLVIGALFFFHHHRVEATLLGVAVVYAMKASQGDFSLWDHIMHHELRTLANLAGLLTGFALLAETFAKSNVPKVLPRYLPNDWKGGFVLLFMVLVLSSFLDNIAAALIGFAIASQVYRGHVHMAFVVAIVAASNAGGSPSVVGDTTTTLIWLDGVSPLVVLEATVGAIVAFMVFAPIAAAKQHRMQPIQKDVEGGVVIDRGCLVVVSLILVGAILANVFLDFPAAGVWGALLIGTPFGKVAWTKEAHGSSSTRISVVGEAAEGATFICLIVLIASLMPVSALPEASAQSTFVLGWISAVFDNIPLTKLALSQGGYDWGVLAFAVGYGGSMLAIGSSSGVAISGVFPRAKSIFQWLLHGWPVVVAYPIAFGAMMLYPGYHKDTGHKGPKVHHSTPAEIPIDTATHPDKPRAK